MKSYKIRTKYTFYSNSSLFSVHFPLFGMLQVRENEISLRNNSGGPEYLLSLEGTLLTMQCKWTFTKHFIFLHYKENARCYGNNKKKTLRCQQ